MAGTEPINTTGDMIKSELAQLLVDVKVKDAACRRDTKRLDPMCKSYNDFAEAMTSLYTFLRGKSISQIEKLCK